MKIPVKFEENNATLKVGFEAGVGKYDEGYNKGHSDGYEKGEEETYPKAYETGKSDGITEGFDKGYDEGYDVGKTDGEKSVVIQGTKSGEVVTMTDVSPNEHEMAVKVKRKNLIPYPYYETTKTSGGITYTDNGDGSITVNGTASAVSSFYLSTSLSTESIDDWFEDGKTYIYRGGNITGVSLVLRYKELSTETVQHIYNNGIFTVDKSKYRYGHVRLQVGANIAVDNVTVYPSLEEVIDISTVNVIASTEDEQIGIHPVNADGTVDGVTSHYPTTILSADKSGVIIECTYNRDISKVVDISIEEGKQAEYDRFWDDYQQNGNRTLYGNAFGACWTANNFRPKYSMRPTSAYMMFFTNMGGGIEIDDFVAFCEENNVVLDFSQCTNLQYALATLHTYHHGVLDFSKATAMQYLFYTHNRNTRSIETIDELISSEITKYAANAFEDAINLTNVTFSGVIAQNIDVSKCTKLTYESLVSMKNVLADKSADTSGTTWTVTVGSTNKAKYTQDDIKEIYAKGWDIR